MEARAHYLLTLVLLAHYSVISSTTAHKGSWKRIFQDRGAFWAKWTEWGINEQLTGKTCERTRICDVSKVKTPWDLETCPGENREVSLTLKPCTQGPFIGDCTDALLSRNLDPGVYDFQLLAEDGSQTLTYSAMCEEGGWTVFQSRGQFGNPVDYFYRGWVDYVGGFGTPGEEVWLGLRTIHELTDHHTEYRLRVSMTDVDGISAEVFYDSFKVLGEEDGYKLSVSGYVESDAGDALGFSKDMKFSTLDNEQDKASSYACAPTFKGAWWYRNCHRTNPNGMNYNDGNTTTFADGIVWYNFRGYQHSLQSFKMAIQPK